MENSAEDAWKLLVTLTNELVIQGQGAGYDFFNKPLCDTAEEIKLHHLK